jgi:hypothetical protein
MDVKIMASRAWQTTLFAISGSSIEFTEFQLVWPLHSLTLSHGAGGQERLGNDAYQMQLHGAIIVTSGKKSFALYQNGRLLSFTKDDGL